MRPWMAESFLRETWDFFIWLPESITQTIENSPVFKKWLENNIARVESSQWLGGSIRTLRAAKHRFESTQKPAGRFILFLEAILKTADRIRKERRGTEPGKRAANFLLGMTEEKLLQLALMADAGDEAMVLTRGVDNESADAAIFPEEIKMFLTRIQLLFVRGQAFECHGYTRFCMQLLEKRNFSSVVDGTTTGVGGRAITAEVRERCLTRMKCWVAVADQVRKAEFPTLEVMSAFSVFNLHGRRDTVVGTLSSDDQSSLKRLAKVYGLDKDKLMAEFADHLPRALVKQKTHNTTIMESWRLAVKHSQKRASTARAHPAAGLAWALKYYISSSISTSGVEQAWSRCNWLLGQGRGHAGEHVEARMIKLVVDYKPNERDEVITRARVLWASGLLDQRGSAQQGRQKEISVVVDGNELDQETSPGGGRTRPESRHARIARVSCPA